MPLLPIRKLPEVSSIGQVSSDVGKLFRWFFGVNTFAGMSSRILGKKFDIYLNNT